MASTTSKARSPTPARVKEHEASAGKANLFLLPEVARTTTGRRPVEYVRNYFSGRIPAPFLSPLARDFDFVLATPLSVHVPGRDRHAVANAIQDSLHQLALFLSNYLTHPRYGAPEQVGFARGDTVRPVDVREVRPGEFRFRAEGIVVGRDDLFKQLEGPFKDPRAVKGPAPGRRAGWLDITINMPQNPTAPGVDSSEWYDFTPTTWLKHHPTIPLVPLAIRLRRRRERSIIAPQYQRLYERGLVRIALLFGYDFESTAHPFAKDARAIWKVVTAPSTRRFTSKDNGVYGFHGPGLGFSNPIAGDFHKLDFNTPTVFRRDAQHGGQITVRYPGVPRGRSIDAEIRLFNFDKSSRRSSKQLIEQFVSVFRDSDVIHYDGHANYGGGFYIGSRNNDILWASDVGKYKRDFSPDYQIFSIAACHAAGYFADLFYHELRPRKSPRNLDVVAAMNEADYGDSVHVALDFVANLLQLDDPVRGRALDYEQLLLELNRPATFQSYIGVFGQRRQRRGGNVSQ